MCDIVTYWLSFLGQSTYVRTLEQRTFNITQLFEV